MTKETLKNRKSPVVVLIDSGIETNKSYLDNCVKLSTGISIKDGYITEDKKRPIQSEHATAIALVIKTIAQDIEFISINILNERLAADFRVLLYALYHAFEQLKPDIIHLSLGTTKWRHYFYLKPIIRKLITNNMILVASADNGGKISFPAFMKGVVGVKPCDGLDSECFCFDGRFFFAPSSLKGIEAAACLSRQDYEGSSLAAAYITGHIAKLMYSGDKTDREYILTKLKENSINIVRKRSAFGGFGNKNGATAKKLE